MPGLVLSTSTVQSARGKTACKSTATAGRDNDTYPYNLPNPGVRDIVRTYIPEKPKLTEGLICRSFWPNPPPAASYEYGTRIYLATTRTYCSD